MKNYTEITVPFNDPMNQNQMHPYYFVYSFHFVYLYRFAYSFHFAYLQYFAFPFRFADPHH